MTSNSPYNLNRPNVTSQQKKDKQQNIINIAVTIVMVLFGTISWLAYSHINKAHQLEQTIIEFEESNKLTPELEVQYNKPTSDLESQKMTNAESNTLNNPSNIIKP